MTILGIDPGTQILGYSLIDTQPQSLSATPEIILLDVLYLKRISDLNLRIGKIFETTARIIDTFHPDHLAIEAPFFGKNVQSMLKLGRAQGVAIAAAISRHIPFSEYEPSVIKQHITGNGNASKEQVAATLHSILESGSQNSKFEIKSPRYLDATDALAVAYTCHLHLSNPLAQLQDNLTPKKKNRKSSKRQWSEFINQNPDRIS